MMNKIKMVLFGAALVATSSALASAQPRDDDRHDGRFEHRDHDRGRDHDRDRGRRFDGDHDRRFRDRDDFRFRDRDDHRQFRDRDDRFYFRGGYRIGERRFFNGYYWDWDGDRWCRRDHGVNIYFRF
jgi:hypothetical protein